MRQFGWTFVVCVVLMMGVGGTVQAQGGPSEDALERVQDYFRTQYGRDFVLIRYNWQQRTWTDSSLGCPRLGFNYESVEITGYAWELELSDNSIYALHSTFDGGTVVLCTDLDRSTSLRFARYQNTDFVLDYPQPWSIAANDDLSNVVISPSGNEDCGDVGVRVQFVPVVGSANTMLDSVLQSAGYVENIGVRVPIGQRDDALALGYQALCDANLVQYRVGAFPDAFTGTGYLMIQRTPLDTYSQWAVVYDRMLESFRLTDTVESLPEAATNVSPEQLLANYPLAHIFAGDIYWGAFDQLPGEALTIDGRGGRRSLRLSPDGTLVAYIERDIDDGIEHLEIGGTAFRRTRIGTNPVAAYFPPTWHPTLNTVAFVELMANDLVLQRADPLNPQAVETIGRVPFDQSACAASEPGSVPERLYVTETGPQGNRFTLEWLVDGRLLLTTACDGTGLAIWNPVDASLQPLGDDLMRASLTPDRTRLAAIGEAGLVFLIDVVSGARDGLPLDVPAEQLAWSSDGRFVYISNHRVTDAGLVIDAPDQESRAIDVFGQFPYTSTLNTLSIIEFDLNRGTTRTVWQGQGFAIGRMVTAPNNGGLVFTLIPSDRRYVTSFLQREDPLSLRLARPETELHWLAPQTEQTRRLAVTAYPAFAYTASSTE